MKNESYRKERRKFIKGISLTLGATFLSSPFYSYMTAEAGNLGKMKNKHDKLGVALVGLGQYSTNQLAPALEETENCYLAGIVTGTPSKADAWKEKYDIPEKKIYNYKNFDEIVNYDDIDIVYVLLPISMHAEFTLRAARAKKHVICEKPMALNAEEGRSLFDACAENGVLLAIGYRLH